MEISKKTINKIILGVVGCILVYWVLLETDRVRVLYNFVKGIFMPFVVGAVIAFILNVPMRAIERLLSDIKKPGLRRGLAILLTFLSIILVLALVVRLLVPQIQSTLESIIALLPGFFGRIQERVVAFLNENPDIMEWVYANTDLENFDWASLIQQVATVVGGSLSELLNRAITAVGSLTNGIFNAVISLVFGLYCLSRKEILARQGRRLLYSFLPEHFCDETVRILRLTNSTFSNFISGQCLEAVILGCLFAVAMIIFRMPYVALVSVLIAITALVPIVGAFVGCILGAFFILVNNPMQAVFFVAMFLVIQQIEGNMIYPRVVGTSVGLPGMWVLVALTVGGEVMGIGGMLLMIPLTSVMYALLREFTNKRLEARGIDRDKLQDHPPELKSKFKEQREKSKARRLVRKLDRKPSDRDKSEK